MIDYSARTTRTVVNLGLISWFNDGADPNFDGVSNECDDVFATTENVLSGRVTTCSRPTTSTTSPTTSSPTTPVTTRSRAVQETTSCISVLLRRARMPTRVTLALTSTTAAGARGDLTVTNDGNSNDGEAGEGDNTWASVFNNGPAGCTENNNDGIVEPGEAPFPSTDTGPITFFDAFFIGQPEPFAGDEADENQQTTRDEMENITGGSGNDVLVGNDCLERARR